MTSATQISVEDFPAHAAGTVDIGYRRRGAGAPSVRAMSTRLRCFQPSPVSRRARDRLRRQYRGGHRNGVHRVDRCICRPHDISSNPCSVSPPSPCFTVDSASQITVQDLPAHASATVDITVRHRPGSARSPRQTSTSTPRPPWLRASCRRSPARGWQLSHRQRDGLRSGGRRGQRCVGRWNQRHAMSRITLLRCWERQSSHDRGLPGGFGRNCGHHRDHSGRD